MLKASILETVADLARVLEDLQAPFKDNEEY